MPTVSDVIHLSRGYVWDDNTLAWIPATPAVAGEVGADVNVTNTSLAVTGPLTDTQLRADAVPVSLASVPSHAITGAVTANAGTDLNTSALALDATLQSVKTAVEVLDNFIAGARGLVTEDNSAAILSGMATAANQATLIAQTAPLVYAQGAAVSDLVGPLLQAAVSDAPQSYTADTARPMSLTTEGRLRVSSVEADITRVWQRTAENPWSTDNPWEMESPYV